MRPQVLRLLVWQPRQAALALCAGRHERPPQGLRALGAPRALRGRLPRPRPRRPERGPDAALDVGGGGRRRRVLTRRGLRRRRRGCGFGRLRVGHEVLRGRFQQRRAGGDVGGAPLPQARARLGERRRGLLPGPHGRVCRGRPGGLRSRLRTVPSDPRVDRGGQLREACVGSQHAAEGGQPRARKAGGVRRCGERQVEGE
mmetsp:Transcript_134138/g.416883  ORF Transcript_134138/g.416883 Transcript_134138/m.416883 type:complete len:200 (-) Transcript_134138:329-928(-)